MPAKKLHAVIDTVVIASVLRRPRGKQPRRIILDDPIRTNRLVVVLDTPGGIVSEWQKTAGPDVKTLVIKWAEWNGVRLVAPAQFPVSLRRCPENLRMRDAVDKLIVRTAVSARCSIVSNESDFWNPDRNVEDGQIGDPNAPVCALLRAIGIRVLTLTDLLAEVSS